MSKDNMNFVLNDAVDTALHFLGKSGEFFPFGVVISNDNKLRHVQGWTGEEQPLSDEVISCLIQGMQQQVQKGEYLTTAIVSDVRTRQHESDLVTDAIRICIEDKDSDPVTCYLPYSVSNATILPGDMTYERGETLIFRT